MWVLRTDIVNPEMPLNATTAGCMPPQVSWKVHRPSTALLRQSPASAPRAHTPTTSLDLVFCGIRMRIALLAAIVTACLVANAAASVGCLGENGQAVDWWYDPMESILSLLFFRILPITSLTTSLCLRFRRIVYKLPDVRGNSAAQGGFGYAYADSSTALHVCSPNSSCFGTQSSLLSLDLTSCLEELLRSSFMAYFRHL